MLSRHDTIDSVDKITSPEHADADRQSRDGIEAGAEDDEMLLDGGESLGAVPSIEMDQSATWSQELPYSPTKRRKLQATEVREVRETTPTKSNFVRPDIPASAVRPPSSTAPHFMRGGITIDSGVASPSFRPIFRQPAPADEASSDSPLPDVFSPHRRGQKFIPGGLAATVQQWIVQAGQTAVSARRDSGEDLLFTLDVHSVCGRGPYVVRGQRSDVGVRCELFLSANVRVADVDLRAGMTVGIRAPVWEVDGEHADSKYTVAADWRLIS